MDPEQDTEITLGTAKLLSLFFGLVIICAVFFALGYTLGRKSDVALSASSAAAPLQTASNNLKPGSSASSQPAPPMTFYKSVEQKDANPQLTPASSDANSSPAAAGQPASSPNTSSSGTSSSGTPAQPAQGANPPDPMVALPTSGYFVQVAAVTKQEDADSLVDALKKKQYPAFVAAVSDKLFRVQVGPFADIKDAEGMRTRLVNDGYNPIVKK
ncbi:MAG TPA: SPOR domain-containing protein [Candidatus Sulfotelmatobacter sp.]|jgi:DedD protein|nr:SPOR domain-containing protein [Candidatus Sulfotelmatobacter sp.]